MGGATAGGTNDLSTGRDSKELSHEEEAISLGRGRQQTFGEGNWRCLGKINHGLEEHCSSSLIRVQP